jgi:hypothetical protein
MDEPPESTLSIGLALRAARGAAALLLSVEAFLLVFSVVVGLAGLDFDERRADLPFGLATLLASAAFVAGTLVLKGVSYFAEHDRTRRALAIGIPATHLILAMWTTWLTFDLGDGLWMFPLWLWFMFLVTAAAFSKSWTPDPAPIPPLHAAVPKLARIGILLALLAGAMGVYAILMSADTESLDDLPTDADLRRDDAQLAIVRSQLEEVRVSLESMPGPSGAVAKVATYSDCHIENGDLHMPAMTKYWDVEPGTSDAAIDSIAAELGKRGWHIDRPNFLLWPWVEYRSPQGWSARGVVYGNVEKNLVGLELGVQQTTPCSIHRTD